jgi:hypothetical protein
MEIYAFGSIVRGEIDEFSDVDLLILKDLGEKIPEIDKERFSIYTFQRMDQLWEEGNPFSWHLFSESKCLFSEKSIPFLKSLGKPKPYSNLLNDLNKFHKLFLDSKLSIESNNNSVDFDLSMIFLAIRNFASCFSLGFLRIEEFSRDTALRIDQYSIQIDLTTYNRLKASRILATRGIGTRITEKELKEITIEFSTIEKWFNALLKLAK